MPKNEFHASLVKSVHFSKTYTENKITVKLSALTVL